MHTLRRHKPSILLSAMLSGLIASAALASPAAFAGGKHPAHSHNGLPTENWLDASGTLYVTDNVRVFGGYRQADATRPARHQGYLAFDPEIHLPASSPGFAPLVNVPPS